MPTLGDELPDVRDMNGSRVPAPAPSQPGVPPMTDAVMRIPVSVQVVIGTARLTLSEVTQLEPGSVVTLQEKLGTPAIILVNGREVGRGELFVLDEEGDRLGVNITSVAGGGIRT